MSACPFPGLLPFQEKDASFFFGRDREIAELLDRLERKRFLGLVGVSGSGKSSLVRAGLKPELRLNRWHVVEVKPGDGPAAELSAKLAEELPGPPWSTLLTRSSYALIDGIKQSGLIATGASSPNLLIIVDQFEEIFDYREEHPQQADLFVQQILRAASHPGLPAGVLLTMRTDYLGKCALFRNLPEALNDGSYLVPRLSRQGQGEAIRSPLAVSGVEIEPGVVDQLLNAAEANRDELPVLQHLLKRLWEESRATGRITAEHLEQTGGWDNAIAEDGEAVLRGLSEMERQAVRLVFQRVTKKGTGEHPVRTPCSFTELAALSRSFVTEDRLREILAEFRKRDLLVWDQESRIDIPHECITWRWAMLATWIDEEDRDRQRIEFIDRSRREETPLAGSALQEALALQERIADPWVGRYKLVAAELTKHVMDSERKVHDAVRRARLVAFVVGVAFVVSVVLGFLLYLQKKESDRQRIAAELQRNSAREQSARADRQAVIAQIQYLNTQAFAAGTSAEAMLLLAAEAFQRSRTLGSLEASDRALRQAVFRVGGASLLEGMAAGKVPGVSVKAAQTSADGHWLAAASRSADPSRSEAQQAHWLSIWDLDSDPRRGYYLARTTSQMSEASTLAISADRNRLAAIRNLGSAADLWSVPLRTAQANRQVKVDRTYHVSLSPDGSFLLVENTIFDLLDPSSKGQELVDKEQSIHSSSRMSRTGRLVVTCTDWGDKIQLWELGADRSAHVIATWVIQPSGETAAWITPDERFVLAVNPSSGKGLYTFEIPKPSRPSPKFAEDSGELDYYYGSHYHTSILSATADGQRFFLFGALWRIVNHRAVREHTFATAESSEQLVEGALSANGHWLATGGSPVRVWDLRSAAPFAKPRYVLSTAAEMTRLVFSPDERWLAAGGVGEARLWDMSTTDPNLTVVPIGFPPWVQKALIQERRTAPLYARFLFTRDSRWLVALLNLGDEVSPSYDIRVFPLLSEAQLSMATELAGRPFTPAERGFYFPEEQPKK